MRKRRWLVGGWPSVAVVVVVLGACDPATPRSGSGSGSGRAPVDAAVDRVFLGASGEGGRGGSPAWSTTSSDGGTAGAGAASGAADPAGSGSAVAPLDGGLTEGRPPDGAGSNAGGPGTGGAATTMTTTGGGPHGTNVSGGMGGHAGGAVPAGGAGSPGAPGGGGAPGTSPTAPPPVSGDLVITELLINPTGTDTGREWIEILNRAGHEVELASVHVADAANDAPIDFEVLAGAAPVLLAGARAVLIQSANAAKNGGITFGSGGLVAVGGAFGTRVSLNNEGDTISLCAGPCAGGVLLDRVTWDGDLGAAYEGHALSIDERGQRCPATAAFGDGGNAGTPGAPNPPCP